MTPGDRTMLVVGVVLLAASLLMPPPENWETEGYDFTCAAGGHLHVRVVNGTVTGRAVCGGVVVTCTPVPPSRTCMATSRELTKTGGHGRCSYQQRVSEVGYTWECWSDGGPR